MTPDVNQNLDILFAPEPDLQAAYGQAHDEWFNAEPSSASGKDALAVKQEMIAVLAEQGKAPGQIDSDLIPDVTEEERQAELDELRQELGIKEFWTPTTEEDFDRLGNRFCALDEEEARVKQSYARRMKKIADKRNYLEMRYKPAMEQFTLSRIGKVKYIDLDSCRFQIRSVPSHWKVVDEKLSQEELLKLGPEAKERLKLSVQEFKVVKSNDKMQSLFKEAESRWQLKQAALKTLEETGEVILEVPPLLVGLERIPETQRFSVKAK